jgi:hypothetical protein
MRYMTRISELTTMAYGTHSIRMLMLAKLDTSAEIADTYVRRLFIPRVTRSFFFQRFGAVSWIGR